MKVELPIYKPPGCELRAVWSQHDVPNFKPGRKVTKYDFLPVIKAKCMNISCDFREATIAAEGTRVEESINHIPDELESKRKRDCFIEKNRLNK